MCKLFLNEEDKEIKTCLISNETPGSILKHFHINPDTKTVYMNGKILSKEDLTRRIPNTGVVHLAIKNKTVMR